MSFLRKNRIILQTGLDTSTTESKAIRLLSMIRDDIILIECSFKDLPKHVEFLKEGAIPVGSVEFVNYVLRLLNIQLPQFHSLNDMKVPQYYYGRDIFIFKKHKIVKDYYGTPFFIKPVAIKLFSGFVYKGDNIDAYTSEYDKEQFNQFNCLPPQTPIYKTGLLNITAEWRCYVLKGNLVSVCQYDDGVADIIPNQNFINSILKHFTGETLAIDIGLLDSGQYVIIELNDAYAIGKYKDISNKDYLDFIATRWYEIFHYGK